MKILNIFKKIITYSFYLLLIFSFVYLIYFINTQDPYKKRLRKELKSIVKKNTFIKHLYNDYRENFLPDTQFIKVNFKKIDLDFLNLNGCYFGKCYTFFLEQYNEKLIIADRKGNIKITTFKNLDKNDPIFSNIQTNLNFDYILDTHVYKNDIYITGKKDIGDKTFLEIVRGKFDEKKINFENIIKLRSENCVLRHAVHSGKIQIYNTLTKQKEDFNPIVKDHVGMYVCGPTVYGEPHLGHARPGITFDIVFRYLNHCKYNVRYVRNITDAGHLENDADEGEDKISKKARLEQLEPMEIVQFYTLSYHKAMEALNCLSPSIEPRATGHIIEQIDMVKQIIKNGFAYEINVSVYLDVNKYNNQYPY